MISKRLQKLLDEANKAICFDQPNLVARIEKGVVFISGDYDLLPLRQEAKAVGKLQQYKIRLYVHRKFPEIEPVLFIDEPKIPKTADYHINEDGSCCVNVWESWLVDEENNTLQNYFDGPLRNYFLSQHIKDTEGNWPFGEWAHGAKGLIEAYAERLDCKPDGPHIAYLLEVLTQDWPKGHWKCPCGSNKRIRDCCSITLQKLSQKVRPKDARRMRKRLMLYLPKN